MIVPAPTVDMREAMEIFQSLAPPEPDVVVQRWQVFFTRDLLNGTDHPLQYGDIADVLEEMGLTALHLNAALLLLVAHDEVAMLVDNDKTAWFTSIAFADAVSRMGAQ